jgi:N-alpha-acetyl-L-2,4-diaminobutyrate deacetylase
MLMRQFNLQVGRRADGEPWNLRFVEIRGAESGPSTAFVGAVFGDKPLGTLALWDLARTLSAQSAHLKGTVLLCPAANPFALEAKTRISPEHLYQNRLFPGAPTGPLPLQLAHALMKVLRDSTDCVVDLHSGTPDMSLWYSYDYGDEALSAAFGYTPIITGMAQPGQLSKAFVEGGGKSVLVEFGGGALSGTQVAVDGCLNILRYRGQWGGTRTGPRRVPVIDRDVSLFIPSNTGVLVLDPPTDAVGKPVPRGPLARIVCPGTGAVLEQFAAERDGALLMLARSSPAMVNPGEFAAGIGYPAREIEVS